MAKKNPEKTAVHMEDGRFWEQFKNFFKKYMENPERSFFSPHVLVKKKKENILTSIFSWPFLTRVVQRRLHTC